MKPLIDGDILLYEISWGGQFKDKETKEETLLDFEKVHEFLEQKIHLICEETEATESPLLFITDSKYLADKESREFIDNFRNKIAISKPYKGTRIVNKPFHYYNLLHTMLADYDCMVAKEGLEADDLMGIYQTPKTIICSRDKDLRMVPGWHYSWECGKQPSHGPIHTDQKGFLSKKHNKLIGYGSAFFFYQMLTGDAVDNIPGLKGYGTVAAEKIVFECSSIKEMYETVLGLYHKVYGEKGWYIFKEQGDLLFIRHNNDEDFLTYYKRLLRWGEE